MNINNLISKETIVVDIIATTKKELLQKISKVAGEKYNIAATKIEDVILERENLGSTGIGKGIAIPHGRVDEINKPIGLFVKLQSPVYFDAIDNVAVDIVFLLLAPVSAGADHLNALATVSGLLKDANNCEKIRSASSAEEIASIIGL